MVKPGQQRLILVLEPVDGVGPRSYSTRTFEAIDHPNYSPEMAIKQIANGLANDLIEHLREN